MVSCPCCGKVLKVELERVLIQTKQLEYKKNGKGLKKVSNNLKDNITEIDLRIFLKCGNCSYASENLNSISSNCYELSHCKDEVDNILNQIYDML